MAKRTATDVAPTVEVELDPTAQDEAPSVDDTEVAPVLDRSEEQVEYEFDAQGRIGDAKGGSEPRWPVNAEQDLFLSLSDGLSRHDACIVADVSMGGVLYRLQRDPAFATRLAKAEIACKLHHLRRVREGESAWQSSAWFLERKWRKEYSLTAPDPDDAENTIRVRRIVRDRGNHQPACEPAGRLSK